MNAEDDLYFKHERLGDASKQIRLLRWAGVREDGTLSFFLRVRTLESGPLYSAISYAWGNEGDERIVLINGKQKLVRPNCHYALWQSMIRHTLDLVWIDYICIDQEHLEEKSEQVQVMPDIYAQAIRVLACVGPHADNTERLFSMWDIMTDEDERKMRRRYNQTGHHGDQEDDQPSVWDQYIEVFEYRTYWNRLWIVPELTNAAQTYILCGTSIISHQKLLSGLKRSRLRNKNQSPLFAEKVLNETQNKDRDKQQRWTVGEVCHLFGRLQCTDLRDHIYAFWRNIKWETAEPPLSKPDYSITAFQLALKISRSCSMHDLTTMFYALGIDMYTKEIHDMLERQRNPIDCGPTGRLDLPASTGGDVWVQLKFDAIAQLFEGFRGHLTAPFKRRSPEEVHHRFDLEPDLDSLFYMEYRKSAKTRDELPPRVFDGRNVAALICPEARPGDYLVSMRVRNEHSGQTQVFCIVIRRAVDHSFDVIGQAVPFNGYSIACESYSTPEFVRWRKVLAHQMLPASASINALETNLTANEIVALLAQEQGPDRAANARARLFRTSTRVSDAPQGAVRMQRVGKDNSKT